jgi:hypothetical protein
MLPFAFDQAPFGSVELEASASVPDVIVPPEAVASAFHSAKLPAPPRSRAMPAAPAIAPLVSLFISEFLCSWSGFPEDNVDE